MQAREPCLEFRRSGQCGGPARLPPPRLSERGSREEGTRCVTKKPTWMHMLDAGHPSNLATKSRAPGASKAGPACRLPQVVTPAAAFPATADASTVTSPPSRVPTDSTQGILVAESVQTLNPRLRSPKPPVVPGALLPLAMGPHGPPAAPGLVSEHDHVWRHRSPVHSGSKT